MENPELNILLIGTSIFDGMAPSTRVRNLLEPLLESDQIRLSNLIYEKDSIGIGQGQSSLNNITYRVIGFRKSNPFSIFSFIWKGLVFIKQCKSNPEKNILYNYDNPDIKNLFLLLYAKLIGYKIVFDIVEDYSTVTKYARYINGLKIKSSVFFLNRSKHLADAVLCISAHLYEKMKKITNQKIPVHFLPISVDLKKFDLRPYQIPDKFKIFYGGSFGAKDGLEYLIKSFEKVYLKHDNIVLILTGRGHESDVRPITNLIKNSPAKKNIHFKGFLSSDAYYNLINDCDIFVMSRVNSNFANAGFPFKLGEFLSVGRAVISTNVGDVPKYLTNDENALVINPNSVIELEAALLCILNKPKDIIRLGTKARKTAEDSFDSKKVSQELFQILLDI